MVERRVSEGYMDRRHKVQFSLMGCFWIGALSFLAGDAIGSAWLFFSGVAVALAALVIGYALMWFDLR